MSAQQRLVLCVDDEVVGLQVRKMILERAGYKVLTAPDGPTSLKLFREQSVGAVVLDYAMPGMDGGEVAGHMHVLKPEVPIILLSAFLSLGEDVTRNVDIYMTKAEGAPSLIDKLETLFSSAVSVPQD